MDYSWLGKKTQDTLPLGYREIYTKYYKLRAFYDSSRKTWRVCRFSYKSGWCSLIDVYGFYSDTNGKIAQKYKTIMTRHRKKFLKLVSGERSNVKKALRDRSANVPGQEDSG